MACGLPVVATSCGGPESIIIDNRLGRLVKNNDVNALAEGLNQIYEATFDKEYIRQYAVNNFSSNIVSKKLIDIYKNEVSL